MDRYAYSGPVKIFGTIVQKDWYAETIAATPAKAKSNLAYQWKKDNGRTASSKVELPGKIILMENLYG